jgi:hypothetical protein
LEDQRMGWQVECFMHVEKYTDFVTTILEMSRVSEGKYT